MKDRINISITPRVNCAICKGLGMVPGDMEPNPFSSGFTREPDTFCDCVIEQVPDDEHGYNITLKFEKSWSIQLDDESNPTEAYIRDDNADGELIAIVYSHADTFMIARAPSMLALLQKLLPIVEAEADQRDDGKGEYDTGGYWAEMREAKEAIAREIWEALGQPVVDDSLPDEDLDDHGDDEDPDGENILVAELKNIANAKYANFETAEEFRAWAQSRARHTLNEHAKKQNPTSDGYDYAADDRNFDADRERRSKR